MEKEEYVVGLENEAFDEEHPLRQDYTPSRVKDKEDFESPRIPKNEKEF